MTGPLTLEEQEAEARRRVVVRTHELAVSLLRHCDDAETVEARAIRLWAQRVKLAMIDGVADPVAYGTWLAIQDGIDEALGKTTVPHGVRAERPEDIGLVSA